MSIISEIASLYADPQGRIECDVANTPTDKRFDLAAAFHEYGIIACGGRDERGYLSSYAFVASESGKPVAVRPLPKPRSRHAAATTSDGRFIIAGGVTEECDGCLALAKSVLEYDLKTDRWSEIAELPLKAAQLVAEVVHGKLVVIAGDTGTTTVPGKPIAPARCRGDVQILDLHSGQWSVGKPKPTPETGVTSAVLGNEIFVVSSYDGGGTIRALVEVYNSKTDTWRRIPDMPTPRTGVPCGFIDGKLYCVNGQGVDLKPVSVVEVYDPKTDRWETAPNPPKASMSQGYANGANRLFLIGGVHGDA
jgi:hypothetical protein